MTSKANVSKLFVLTFVFIFLTLLSCDKKTYEPTLPQLVLSTTYEEYSAPVGGPSPNFFFVHVTSDSGADIDFAFTEHSLWMSLANAKGVPVGTTPDSFLVEFKVAAPVQLDVGTYEDTIFVSSDEVSNSPQMIVIKLNMISTIQTAPKYLNFSAAKDGFNPADKHIKIYSISSEQFDYTLSSNASWINLPQTTGTTSGVDSVPIGINAAGLTEGIYVDSVIISAPTAYNSPVYLPCSLSVSPWMTQTEPNIGILLDVFFEDQFNGWAAGFIADAHNRTGYILNTTNSGQTWNINYLGNTLQNRSTELFGSIQFFGQIGWVIGEKGLICKSTDHGMNWNVIESGLVDSLIDYNDMFFLSKDTGWLVGDSGFIIKTVDGGQNWTKQNSGTNLNLTSVSFIDDQNGWAAGSVDVILHTANGGASWVTQTVPLSPTINDNYDFNDIFFVNSNVGFAIGKSGHIVQTIDGGQSWLLNKLDFTNAKLSSIFFVDNNYGWISGEAGLILYTSDGGMNWTEQFSNTNNWLNSIYFLDHSNGWVVGIEGTIRYTGSGGN